MKIDLHTHSYYSDGLSSPTKLVEEAFKKGLDGIALTDHQTTRGWTEAEKRAKELGICFIPGQEIKTKQGEVLALFIKEEIKPQNYTLDEVITKIRKQGGIVIFPHPLCIKGAKKKTIEKYNQNIDGLEILNARWPGTKAEKRAFSLAQKYSLATTGGSDAHYFKEVGWAYTVAQEARNVEEFKKAILEKKVYAQGKKAPLRYLVFRIFFWTKLFHLWKKIKKFG